MKDTDGFAWILTHFFPLGGQTKPSFSFTRIDSRNSGLHDGIAFNFLPTYDVNVE